MTIEKLAKQIFDEFAKDGEPVTMEEAIEMAQMELKAKKDCKTYVQSEKPRAKLKKERKVDTEKLELWKMLIKGLSENNIDYELENEVALHFEYGGNAYSLKLTKHRPPK